MSGILSERWAQVNARKPLDPGSCAKAWWMKFLLTHTLRFYLLYVK